MNFLDYIFYTMGPFVPVLFLLLGFLRSSVDGTKPKGLVDLKTINDKWINDSSWLSRITPIFSVFIVIYNALIWALYSLISILDFVKFIFTKAWWLVLWIWNEVIHPTLFLVVKLLWHYIVIFCWKFFRFSFSKENISRGLGYDNLKHAVFTMLQINLLLGFFLIIGLLFNFSPAATGGLAVLFIVFFQYHIFNSTNFYKGINKTITQKIKIVVSSLVIGVFFISLILLFRNYSHKVILQGLGVSIAQISTPLAIAGLFIFTISSFFLSPYIVDSNSEKFSVLSFLKQTFIRVPKLLYSLPFHLTGLVISSIIPIIICLVLSYGIKSTTNYNISEWNGVVMDMSSHIPNIKENKKGIKILRENIAKEDTAFLYDKNAILNEISSIEMEIEVEEELKSKLKPNKIFSFSGSAYVGEVQTFSYLEVLNSDYYNWKVYQSSNDSVVYKSRTRQRGPNDLGVANAYTFNYKWRKSGDFRVEVSPKNGCGSGKPVSLMVNVKERPDTKLFITNPNGKDVVCPGDTVDFYADGSDWIKSWHWELPKGCDFISEDTKQQIKVVWGDKPGTIRVYAVGEEGAKQTSIKTGLLVNVQPKVGNAALTVEKVPDEKVVVFEPPRAFLYYNLVDPTRKILELEGKIEALENKLKELEDSHNTKISELTASISVKTKNIKTIRAQIFGTILAVLGLMLFFSLLMSAAWTYFVNYNYDIYNYEQDGEHYLANQYNYYKAKNANQPLLGWFIVIIIIVVLYIVANN